MAGPDIVLSTTLTPALRERAAVNLLLLLLIRLINFYFIF